MLKKMPKLLFVLALLITILPTKVMAYNTYQSIDSKIIKLNEAEVSEVLTYDELIEAYAYNEGVSLEVAKEKLFPTNNGLLPFSVTAATYRTISDTLNVTANYKPKINFYCQTSEGGGHGGIVSILNANLNRVYNGKTYQYRGTIYYNLEDPNRIYYTMDGDWYQNGTTTVSGGGTVGVGGAASLSFSVSNSSNYYSGFYVATTLRWGV